MIEPIAVKGLRKMSADIVTGKKLFRSERNRFVLSIQFSSVQWEFIKAVEGLKLQIISADNVTGKNIVWATSLFYHFSLVQ